MHSQHLYCLYWYIFLSQHKWFILLSLVFQFYFHRQFLLCPILCSIPKPLVWAFFTIPVPVYPGVNSPPLPPHKLKSTA